jgi:hypothetical protein
MLRTLSCVMLSAAFLACGGVDEEEKPVTCEQDCARQVAAGCPNTPEDYLETCTQGCASNRQNIGTACRDELDAIYVCAGSKQKYTCNSSGAVYPDPIAACAAEAIACAACAGLACLPPP